jgi:hypothetical protein
MPGWTSPAPKSPRQTANAPNRDVPQTQAGEYFRTIYDLMVLAFQTDATRVATFSSGNEGQGLPIPELQIPPIQARTESP